MTQNSLALLFEPLPDRVRVAYSEQMVTVASPYPEEEAFIERAVVQRQQEFRTGRSLARSALGKLGIKCGGIPAGAGRAPQWPKGTIGSISHCRGLCAAVVASENDYRAIGLDLEVSAPVAADLVPMIYAPTELSARDSEPTAHPLDLINFSAKESVFKCLYPLIGSYFDFQDVSLSVDLSNGRFRAFPKPRLAETAGVEHLDGQFRLHAGYLITFCQIPAA